MAGSSQDRICLWRWGPRNLRFEMEILSWNDSDGEFRSVMLKAVGILPSQWCDGNCAFEVFITTTMSSLGNYCVVRRIEGMLWPTMNCIAMVNYENRKDWKCWLRLRGGLMLSNTKHSKKTCIMQSFSLKIRNREWLECKFEKQRRRQIESSSDVFLNAKRSFA